MAKRRKQSDSALVVHPRYGSAPHVSGIQLPESEIRAGSWSGDSEIYPASVLLADWEKQNFSTMPRRYYVDTRKICRVCSRPFIFFAKEQRHWFEVLRFTVDAGCVHCSDCRRESRTVKARLRRYSDAMAQPSLSDDELDALVKDAAFLLDRGMLKNLTVLGALKNQAERRLPCFESTAWLKKLLAAAHAERFPDG